MTDLPDLIRVTRRLYRSTERRLVSPCCRMEVVLNVADALGGWHWCECGQRWKMLELVRKDAE